MHSLIWIVSAGKRSIVKALRERCPVDSQGGLRRGVPGNSGSTASWEFPEPPGVDVRSWAAFRRSDGPASTNFTQELVIGKRRGLMRLCLAEGAQVHAAFFFGTSRPADRRPGPVRPHGDALAKDARGRHGLLRALVPADPAPRRALGLRRARQNYEDRVAVN